MATRNIISRIKNDDNPSYVDKLVFIKQFDTINLAKNRKNFNKSEKIRLTKRFKKLKRFVSDKVAFKKLDKQQLKALENKDFNVTGLGIFIAKPQSTRTHKPIPGVRIRVNKNGTIVTSKGSRVEYTVALSKDQIKRLITGRPNINNDVVTEIFDNNPGLAKQFRAALPKDRHIQILFTTHRSNQQFKTIASLQNYIDGMVGEARNAINALVFTIFKRPKKLANNRGQNKSGKKTKKKKGNNRRRN